MKKIDIDKLDATELAKLMAQACQIYPSWDESNNVLFHMMVRAAELLLEQAKQLDARRMH